jgi:predicted nucleic-acid-binding protein
MKYIWVLFEVFLENDYVIDREYVYSVHETEGGAILAEQELIILQQDDQGLCRTKIECYEVKV